MLAVALMSLGFFTAAMNIPPAHAVQYYVCTYANPSGMGTSAGFTISGVGTFYDGGRAAVSMTSYTISAGPIPSGYKFSSWSADNSRGQSVTISNPSASSTTVTFASTGWDGTCIGGLSVNYVVDYYVCTYVNPNGMGTSAGFSINGVGTFYDGGRAEVSMTSYTINAGPIPSGYTFSSWSADNSRGQSVTISNPSASSTTVTFASTGWDGVCIGGLSVNYATSSYSYTAGASGLDSGVYTYLYLDGGYTTYLYSGDTYTYSGLTGSHTISVDQYTQNGAPGDTRYHATTYSRAVSASGSYTFAYHAEYLLSMSSSGSGTTTPAGGSYWYDSGTNVSVNASPSSGWSFSSWSDGGAKSHTVTMNQARYLTAYFVQTPYSYTCGASGLGSGVYTYCYLDGGSAVALYNGGTYTYSGLTGSHTISVDQYTQYGAPGGVRYHATTYQASVSSSGTTTFTYHTEYLLTLSVSGSGTTTPAVGSYWYDSGTNVSVNASPSSGWAFSSWSDGGAQSHTVAMSQARTITATFTQIPYSYTFNESGLPGGTTWGVTVGGTRYTTSSSSYTASGLTGTVNYSYDSTVGAYSCYSGCSGSVSSTGSTTGYYQIPTYSYTFQESGLPNGATWGVTVGGTRYTTSSSSQVVSGLSGTVNYSYDSTVGAYSCTSGCSGSFSSAGSTTGYYTLSMYAGTFRQTGIPAGTTWGVTVGGTHYASTGANVTVPGMSGTIAYSYDTPVSGTAGTRYTCSGCSGSVSNPTPVTVNYVPQYQLTMQSNPSGGSSTTPTTGNWYNATTLIPLMTATAAQGYAFTSWSGSGPGSYTGTSNPCINCVTMNGPVTETANVVNQAVMRVSYAVVAGGSGFVPPTFNYVQGGASKFYQLTGTAADISCDVGSSWSVSPNPLSGSSSSEQWLSGQTLSGTASAQTIVFSFQHQYMLTTQASPSASGTAAPATGWQNAGADVGISFTENSGYAFQSWTGSGTGSYSGTDNQATVTMNGPITETGNSIQVATLVVSYTVIGGGSPGAPTISYIQGGSSKQYILTQTPQTILADPDSAWSVLPNPLTGSGTSERWISNQTLSGEASGLTIVFSFQHQYTLSVSVTPVGSGTTSPSGTTWQDAGSTAVVVATPNGEYSVSAWAINGQQVQGQNNQLPVLMSEQRVVVALFGLGGFCPYVSSNPPELSPQPTLSPHCPINPGTVVTVTAPAVVNWKFTNFTVTGTTHTEHGNQATFNMPTGDVSVIANYEYAGSDVPGAGGGVTVPAYDTPLLMIAAVLTACTIAGARLGNRRTSKHKD